MEFLIASIFSLMFPISLFISSVSLSKKIRKHQKSVFNLSAEIISYHWMRRKYDLKNYADLWGCYEVVFTLLTQNVLFFLRRIRIQFKGFGFYMIWRIMQISESVIRLDLAIRSYESRSNSNYITNSPRIGAHFCCCKQSLFE